MNYERLFKMEQHIETNFRQNIWFHLRYNLFMFILLTVEIYIL